MDEAKAAVAAYENGVEKVYEFFESLDRTIEARFAADVKTVNDHESLVLGNSRLLFTLKSKPFSSCETFLTATSAIITRVLQSYNPTHTKRQRSLVTHQERNYVGMTIARVYLTPALDSSLVRLPPHPNVQCLLPLTYNLGPGNHNPESWIRFGFHSPDRTVTDLKATIKTVGESGNSPLQFRYPLGIAVHPSTGNLYVVECDNRRIKVLKPDLELVSIFGKSGSAPGEFHEPRAIAISLNGTIAVVDNCNSRIQIFDSEFALRCIVDGKFGEHQKFRDPRNIAVDDNGFFYITDRNNERILKITEAGEPVCEIGAKGSLAPIGLAYGITINTNNELLATAHGGNVVRAYTLDGTHIRDIPVKQTSNSWPSNYLARGVEGGFVLVNVNKDVIYFYNYEGVLVHELPAPHPVGVVFGLDNQFYVVENQKCQVSVY